MGEAKRRKHSATAGSTQHEYRELEAQGRKFVVEQILSSTRSPQLRKLYRQLMKIDSSGRLLCAWCTHMREAFDHAIARKGAGQSDAEVSAAYDRAFREWFAKGPRKIIAEFDAEMKSNVFGPPAGTPTH